MTQVTDSAAADGTCQQNMKCVQEDEAAHTQYQRPAVTVICVRKTREPAIILSSLWSF